MEPLRPDNDQDNEGGVRSSRGRAVCGWPIEETFQTSKGQTRLDQYQVRQYTGWYRHIMLANAS